MLTCVYLCDALPMAETNRSKAECTQHYRIRLPPKRWTILWSASAYDRHTRYRGPSGVTFALRGTLGKSLVVVRRLGHFYDSKVAVLM